MRIALATEFAPPRHGGIERQVTGLAGALADLGHEPTILTPLPGPEVSRGSPAPPRPPRRRRAA